MTSSDLYALFRLDVSDSVAPYLWSDLEVFSYMNDAYRMFVRLTGGIPDFTSAATQVPIVATNNIGVLSPSILRIMSASRLSDGGKIRIVNSPDLPIASKDDYGWAGTLSLDNKPGPVRYMMIGAQKNVARWIQTPVVNDTAQLVIYRLPIGTITGLLQPFTDVEDDHILHLLTWMRRHAYLKQDTETFDKIKSAEQDMLFRVYCSQVKDEIERYKYKPRTVTYGGL